MMASAQMDASQRAGVAATNIIDKTKFNSGISVGSLASTVGSDCSDCSDCSDGEIGFPSAESSRSSVASLRLDLFAPSINPTPLPGFEVGEISLPAGRQLLFWKVEVADVVVAGLLANGLGFMPNRWLLVQLRAVLKHLRSRPWRALALLALAFVVRRRLPRPVQDKSCRHKWVLAVVAEAQEKMEVPIGSRTTVPVEAFESLLQGAREAQVCGKHHFVHGRLVMPAGRMRRVCAVPTHLCDLH